MERLLADAQAISGVEYKIESFSDIIAAIHVIQTQLGITGTTSAEAASTIEGSMKSVKAAWENLLTEIAKDNANIDELSDYFALSLETAGENMIPRVETIFGNIGNVIEQLAPEFADVLTGLLDTTLPSLMQSAVSLLNSVINVIVNTLPTLARSIIKALPELWNGLKEVGSLLWDNVIVPAWDFVVHKLPTYINDTLKRINFKDIGASISKLIRSGMTGLAEFVNDIDWNEVGKNIGDFILNIDWLGILANVFDLLTSLITSVPSLVGGLFSSVSDKLTDLLIGTSGDINGKISDEFEEARKSAHDLTDQIDEARRRYDELAKSAADVIENDDIQINKTQSLWDELQKLVDAEGNIKKGYENRVNYIANELSKATDTEIDIIDGQIQKYGELKEAIQDTINMQRAQSMGNAYQSLYQEAIQSNSQYGTTMLGLKDSLSEYSTELVKYYNEFMSYWQERVRDPEFVDSQDISQSILGMNVNDFRRNIGTNGAIGNAMYDYFGESEFNAMSGLRDEIEGVNSEMNTLKCNQERYNKTIELYEKAEEELLAGNYSAAEATFAKINDLDRETLHNIEDYGGDTLDNIEYALNDALRLYNENIEGHVTNAEGTLQTSVDTIVDYAKREGVTGAELTKTGILDVLASMESFDTSKLQAFMAETGIDLGMLLQEGIYSGLSDNVQSYLNQHLYDTNNLIVASIQSPGDVERYKNGEYELGIRRRALGGVFRRTTEVFGEAGIEAAVPLYNDQLGIRQIAGALSRNMSSQAEIRVENNIVVNANETDGVNNIGSIIVEKIDEALRDYQIQQARAVGGTGW